LEQISKNKHTAFAFIALALYNRLLDDHNANGGCGIAITHLHRIEIWWALVQ